MKGQGENDDSHRNSYDGYSSFFFFYKRRLSLFFLLYTNLQLCFFNVLSFKVLSPLYRSAIVFFKGLSLLLLRSKVAK